MSERTRFDLHQTLTNQIVAAIERVTSACSAARSTARRKKTTIACRVTRRPTGQHTESASIANSASASAIIITQRKSSSPNLVPHSSARNSASHRSRVSTTQYLKHWLEMTKADSRAIFTAAARGQEAVSDLASLQPAK